MAGGGAGGGVSGGLAPSDLSYDRRAHDGCSLVVRTVAHGGGAGGGEGEGLDLIRAGSSNSRGSSRQLQQQFRWQKLKVKGRQRIVLAVSEGASKLLRPPCCGMPWLGASLESLDWDQGIRRGSLGDLAEGTGKVGACGYVP